MTRLFITISILLFTHNIAFAQFTTSDVHHIEKPSAGTGLEGVYIFKNLLGASISYKTKSTDVVEVFTYTNDQHDKIPVPSSNLIETPTLYTVKKLQDGQGVIFEINNQSKAAWIIDYSLHRPLLKSIEPAYVDDPCNQETLKLLVDKDDLIQYRGTLQGSVRDLVRKYIVTYDYSVWKEEEEQFVTETHSTGTDPIDIGTEVQIEIPNMDTEFTISGDHIGEKLGETVKLVSNLYVAIKPEGHIITKQVEKQISNINTTKEGLNAPIDIDFFGHANRPTTDYYSWSIYNIKDEKNPIARYTDKDMSYRFEEAANYKIVLEVANLTSGCVDTTSTTLQISESFLDAPNFFRPGNPTGEHAEFRVAYKSLTKFRCVIFNRWGNKVYQWSDPEQGWDGRYNGKFVNPGVYFYIIEATGSDGKVYKEKGDINIL